MKRSSKIFLQKSATPQTICRSPLTAVCQVGLGDPDGRRADAQCSVQTRQTSAVVGDLRREQVGQRRLHPFRAAVAPERVVVEVSVNDPTSHVDHRPATGFMKHFTGFILHGLARKLYWLKPELIEGLSMVGIVEF